jgi:hypothetical protein
MRANLVAPRLPPKPPAYEEIGEQHQQEAIEQDQYGQQADDVLPPYDDSEPVPPPGAAPAQYYPDGTFPRLSVGGQARIPEPPPQPSAEDLVRACVGQWQTPDPARPELGLERNLHIAVVATSSAEISPYEKLLLLSRLAREVPFQFRRVLGGERPEAALAKRVFRDCIEPAIVALQMPSEDGAELKQRTLDGVRAFYVQAPQVPQPALSQSHSYK